MTVAAVQRVPKGGDTRQNPKFAGVTVNVSGKIRLQSCAKCSLT